MSEEIKNSELVSFLARHCHEDTRVYSAASVDAILPILKGKMEDLEKENVLMKEQIRKLKSSKKNLKYKNRKAYDLLEEERNTHTPIYSDGDDSVDWIG